jgi:hypothetical protein
MAGCDRRIPLLIAILIFGLFFSHLFFGVISRTALKILAAIAAEFIAQVAFLWQLFSTFILDSGPFPF